MALEVGGQASKKGDLVKLGIRGGEIMKCDQEETLQDFVKHHLTKLHTGILGVRTTVEHSAVCDSRSNECVWERARRERSDGVERNS